MIHGLALCAGIGGLELGLKMALGRRYRCVCYVERDAFAASILVARMAEAALDTAPIWDDVKTFDGFPWRGKVDLVSAGYPCQPFSNAGFRLGDIDDRHLWPDIARIMREIEPTWGFFENVSGHISLGFEQIHDDLEAMGYVVATAPFRANEVGAPHKRERFFILAHSDRTGLEDREPKPEPRSISAAWPPGPDDTAWTTWDGPKPAVRRDAHGISDRVDRLRSLGNAVVPDVAAIAFSTLARSILKGHA